MGLRNVLRFDFERPNCVAGGKSAANLLASHALQFIDLYSGRHVEAMGGRDGNVGNREKSRQKKSSRPWAAFLSFEDGREDTNTLLTSLDDVIPQPLHEVRRSAPGGNTMIVITSHGGIKHGTYSQSLDGQKDSVQPFLSILYPKNIVVDSVNARNDNLKKLINPLDVYATMVDVLLDTDTVKTSDGFINAFSLLSAFPLDRREGKCSLANGFLKNHCDLRSKTNPENAVSSMALSNPPNVLSFFADIPHGNRIGSFSSITLPPFPTSNFIKKNKLIKDYKKKNTLPTPATFLNAKCICATSVRSWYNCSHHPWNTSWVDETKDSGSNKIFTKEKVTLLHDFALIDCVGLTLSYEAKIQRNEQRVTSFKNVIRSEKVLKKGVDDSSQPPNILFIEVDSVSISHADRHLTKTRQLLWNHRMKGNSDDNDKNYCKDDLCSFDFERFVITGPNSITNQVSTMAGCVVSPAGRLINNAIGSIITNPDNPLFLYNLRLFTKYVSRVTPQLTWCVKDASHENGRSPWIFDVAKKEGYITLFGEEFCYKNSPYVTQGNIFRTEADVDVLNIFCELAKRKALKDKLEVDNLRSVEDKFPCLDALDHIEKMWNSYHDVPKFAFVNAISAHDYSGKWKDMDESLRAYDLHLRNFLQQMLSRDDANNTIIIVRSDHGLQGGINMAEFSNQVEHLKPWTQIIVPKDLPGIDLKALKVNQKRLLTGFDLYHTLRVLMASNNDKAAGSKDKFIPSLPDWSHSIMTTEIPWNRSCKDAKVPLDYSPFEGNKFVPTFGICNKFEPIQFQFCNGTRQKMNKKRGNTEAELEVVAKKNRAKNKAHRNKDKAAFKRNRSISEMLARWGKY